MSSDPAKVVYAYQNPDLPLETRVNDLISHLTLEEKINLMCQYQDEVTRLGIKPYKHGTEAAHGIAWLGKATTFPQPIGLACTWDKELMKKVGEVIGTEARAFYRLDPAINGLTLWAPTVDLERDPRWGRTEEGYGEDPYLTGHLAAALVRGIQGDHPTYLRAVASLKHFLGNNNEVDRGSCSVSLDPRNMREYYLKVFEIPFVEGGAQSMMTAYNAVNGVPANLNPDIIRIVKREWGMDGFVVSDAGDVLGTVNDHHYYETDKEAVAYTIKSGIDSITDDHDRSKRAIREALAEGLLTENDLDIALRNTFRVRFRLGEFDPDDRNPYASISETAILRPEHISVSREAAQKSIVLLKNEDHMLPLQAGKHRKVAVIGPLSDIVYRDWYSGTLPYGVTVKAGVAERLGDEHVSFASGCDVVKLRSKSNDRYIYLDEDGKLRADEKDAARATQYEVTDWGWNSHTMRVLANGKYVTTNDAHLTGTADEVFGWFTKEVILLDKDEEESSWRLNTWNGHAVRLATDGSAILTESRDAGFEQADVFAVETVKDGIAEAVRAAKEAEVAIVVVGNHPLVNGKETIDRPDLTLPASQERLIRAVYEANPHMVVVIIGSYPFAIPWADEHVPAILYSSHAGQELGHAIADVLFGDVNPAGRLNFTWYRSVDQLPDIMDYDIIKGKRTYQYFEGDVLYPFGHGLSYARFTYRDLHLDRDRIASDDTVTVRVEVTNESKLAGEEVIQLYVRASQSRVVRPLKQLRGFERVMLQPSETRTISLQLKGTDLAIWDVTRDQFTVESGDYTIMLGSSSTDIRVTAILHVDGETIPARNLRNLTQAINYDDYSGVVIGECREGGSCTTVVDPEGWVSYHDAVLDESVTSFEARVASETGGTLELRVGSPNGTIIGVCVIPPSDGPHNWQTHTCAISVTGGHHDVYLRFIGKLHLSWFRFI